jgi:RNA recognition motif-containing protein
MADAANFRQRNRLSPDVTRILYVRNLPFKLSSDELYDIFGKYGPIRQVRLEFWGGRERARKEGESEGM